MSTEWMDEEPYPGPEWPRPGLPWSSEYSDPFADFKLAIKAAMKAYAESFEKISLGIWLPPAPPEPPKPPLGKKKVGSREMPIIQHNAGPYSGDFQFDHRGRKRY